MVRRIVLWVCAAMWLSEAAVAATPTAISARGAAPFECKTQLTSLPSALHAFAQLPDNPDAEDDDDDSDEAKVAYAPDGVRVFGFQPDELDLVLDPDGVELTAFVHASYDDVVRATEQQAQVSALNLPRLTVEPADDADGDTVISCVYKRGQPI